MATLRVETQKIPASALGPENPLPDLSAAAPEPGAQATLGPADPAQAYFKASHIKGCLPYRVQDGYDRGQSDRPFRMAVLENRHLRAAFLLELQVECGRAIVEAGRFTDLDRWLGTLPESVRRSGRIELFAARAALEHNDTATAERILDQVQLVDIREGEIALTDLWFAIQERRIAAAEGVPIDAALRERVRRTLSPPARLDFRMH